MEFNSIPLTGFAESVAQITGVEAPEFAKTNVPEINALVREKTGKDTVDRAVIYNPDAIGQWFADKHTDIMEPVTAIAQLRVPYLTSFPPKTPVCFGTMFTGATPEEHGIRSYDKHLLTTDSLFDRWSAAHKKVALVSVAGQSIPILFAERKIDYFLTSSDRTATEKALELIASKEYDIIELYNMEYDSVMHATYPESRLALNAARHHAATFAELYKAVKENYKGYDTFMAFSPDHGVHREWYGLGNHGKNITKDMNIYHYYLVV